VLNAAPLQRLIEYIELLMSTAAAAAAADDDDDDDTDFSFLRHLARLF